MVITAMAGIISTYTYVPWYIIPIVFIFGILGVGVIGAFILRYNGELTEANFLTLIIEILNALLTQNRNLRQCTTQLWAIP